MGVGVKTRDCSPVSVYGANPYSRAGCQLLKRQPTGSAAMELKGGLKQCHEVAAEI